MFLFKQPFPGSVFKKALVLDVVRSKFRVTKQENAAPMKVSESGNSVLVRRVRYPQKRKSKHERTGHSLVFIVAQMTLSPVAGSHLTAFLDCFILKESV